MVFWLENVKLNTKEHYRNIVVGDLFLAGDELIILSLLCIYTGVGQLLKSMMDGGIQVSHCQRDVKDNLGLGGN